MLKLQKIALLCTFSLLGLSSCSEEDEIVARKRGNTPTQSMELDLNGIFMDSGISLTLCPVGLGARLQLNFANSTLDLDIPLTDLTNMSSTTLATFNTTKFLESPPTLNASMRDFAAVFVFNDPSALFDGQLCDDIGGGVYSNFTELRISGTVSTDDTVPSAAYTISNRCTVAGAASQICSGMFVSQ